MAILFWASLARRLTSAALRIVMSRDFSFLPFACTNFSWIQTGICPHLLSRLKAAGDRNVLTLIYSFSVKRYSASC